MKNTSAFQPRGTTRAYYTLNGNSHDRSGNGVHGTDTAITYPQGRFGQGARFNGTTSKIALGNPASLQTTTCTSSVWVKSSNFGASYRVLYNAESGFGFFIKDGILLAYDYGASADRTTSVNISDDKWHNCVYIFNSGVTNGSFLYIDGILRATFTATASSFTSINIGNNVISTQGLTGLIDEVIIESRAWTAKEVETYYRKSMLNYRQKGLGQMVWTYISELGTGIYTLSGKNLNVLRNYVSQLLTGAYTFAGKQLTVSKAYTAHLLKGVYNLVGKHLKVPQRWLNQDKPTSTFTNKTKPTSIWTDQLK
jgi:hypothetical protein